jgi:hypothetical protein
MHKQLDIENISNTEANGRRLSLIARGADGIKLRSKVDGVAVYESSFWVLGTESADALIGGEVLFHERQSDASYFGGRVIAIERLRDGEFVGRAVIVFAAQSACKGIHCTTGWARESAHWSA